ncbi:hypothetical protein AUC69_12795 [Methyloceanibacter superfactus]|uniref:Uncharacterized protein n=1 Tax=Methyloceanibacter superfactus TaxID=1774969 RepID=A0A1E3VTZ6_9HYPH|nr:hypothetical protein AUC69_12795 [Methyloceanibacter superfactus]
MEVFVFVCSAAAARMARSSLSKVDPPFASPPASDSFDISDNSAVKAAWFSLASQGPASLPAYPDQVSMAKFWVSA